MRVGSGEVRLEGLQAEKLGRLEKIEAHNFDPEDVSGRSASLHQNC